MFTPTGLFKNIACPYPEKCAVLSCIFSHDPRPVSEAEPRAKSLQSATEPAVKRRRVDDGPVTLPRKKAAADGSVADSLRGEIKAAKAQQSSSVTTSPKSLQRTISPPPARSSHGKSGNAPTTRPLAASAVVTEVLNPRMLAKPPDSHAKRLLYLQHMHEQMKRLNASATSEVAGKEPQLLLDEQQLIKLSLDEEVRLASESSAVYGNVVKQRIMAFKKMKLEDWLDFVRSRLPQPASQKSVSGAGIEIKTDLTSAQQVTLLKSRLLTPVDTLIKLEYVLDPPPAPAIDDAHAMVVSAMNWEVCDRCKTRFQVFPERRAEDGAMTTNGPCVYHWGKLRRPRREKTDAQTGAKESVYTCCGEPMNTPGCVEADSHVYKIIEPARMAAVMQFLATPDNDKPRLSPEGGRVGALTFDCEMGYTVHGLELIRLTALSWPSNELLIDVLVKPKGTILDLNTRFSGVTKDDYTKARPFSRDVATEGVAKKDHGEALSLVSSPEAARELLCSYITPDTVLIGHALENDMNSIRLCHRTIVDTAALYPHARGPPVRHGLKHLSLVHLERDIQTGGAAGHDSLEDAIATADLVRAKASNAWDVLKQRGWRFEGDRLLSPGAA